MRFWVQMRSRTKMSFLHFCDGYTSKSSHAQFYRYIPSSFRDIKEFNFNGSPDIGKKSIKKLSFFSIIWHAYHFHWGEIWIL